MRVGEMNACRFCDVRIVKEKTTNKKVLMISNINGKKEELALVRVFMAQSLLLKDL
jgi:hypothetical protein